MPFSIEHFLLGASILILLSVTVSKISDKFAVPALLFFMLIGILAGNEGIGVHFNDLNFARDFGIIALVVIVFTGGLDTRFKDIKSLWGPGIVLSTAGILLTTFLVGLCAVYVLNFSLLEGLLLGAVVSSTDAAAVFCVLRTRRVSLKGVLRPLLEFESSSNDPMAVFLTVAFIGLVQRTIAPHDIPVIFLLEMGMGAFVGWLMARGGLVLIRRLRIESVGLYPALTLSLVILTYSMTELLNGNGILAAYLMGLIMGQEEFLHKKAVKQFYEGLTWLMQIAMFLVLGLLVVPSHIPAVLPAGIVIALFLMFVARPLSVFLSLTPFHMSFMKMVMVSWVGLRGAAPIILAVFPLLAGVPHSEVMFNVVFIVVLISILVQGSLIAPVSRLLNVAVPLGKRRKYPIQFEHTEGIQATLTDLIVPYDSVVAGRPIVDMKAPSESLVVLISRDDQFIVPNGATIIEGGDVLLVLGDGKALAQMQSVLQKMKPSGDRA